MTFEVYVEPKNEQAREALNQNFKILDDKFKEVHDQSFMHDGKRCEHGLKLFDQSSPFQLSSQDNTTFVRVYAHWDYDHLMATKADVENVVEKVFGSTKDYKIRESR